jgi:UDP-N-acetylglucosamine diphosphorylase / glucose-1-phosphate thymidylyltransferase / UDP-N-acetylgalactosamine diphosphorylase / glucosamine-1-phosphate N-acetyltransferase / galactosamine-1-phosphate N-acetyltransferase
MQAVILAAGKGTRLMPLTKTTPKALVSVNGKPLLQILLEQLKSVDVTEIIVVVHHLQQEIKKYFGDGQKFGVSITYVTQEKLRGNADALATVEPYIENSFLCLAVDSLFETDILRKLMKHDSDGVITCKEVVDTSRFGTLRIDERKVLQIVEKSKDPPSHLANFSVYLFPHEIIEACKTVPESTRNEYELTDAIQALIEAGMIFEYETSEHIIDIGTPEQLQEAQELAKKLDLS